MTDDFSAGSIIRIQFSGNDGHDHFRDGLSISAYGHDGNDTLSGTLRNDYFSGGNDHDVIIAGSGNDTNYGGYATTSSREMQVTTIRMAVPMRTSFAMKQGTTHSLGNRNAPPLRRIRDG